MTAFGFPQLGHSFERRRRCKLQIIPSVFLQSSVSLFPPDVDHISHLTIAIYQIQIESLDAIPCTAAPAMSQNETAHRLFIQLSLESSARQFQSRLCIGYLKFLVAKSCFEQRNKIDLWLPRN